MMSSLRTLEVAERLRVNQQTVRNWIDRGELDALRIGPRRIRIPSGELDRFIAESSAGQLPDENMARSELNHALKAVRSTMAAADLRLALRRRR
jgi:excisionase family DNA binding protein